MAGMSHKIVLCNKQSLTPSESRLISDPITFEEGLIEADEYE